VNNPDSAMGPADEDNLAGSVAEPSAQSEVADAVGSLFSGPVSFGENFAKKVRKHIDQVRNRGPTREAINSPAKGGSSASDGLFKIAWPGELGEPRHLPERPPSRSTTAA
jgi:hypothetical protein